jgi:hypothetical protein
MPNLRFKHMGHGKRIAQRQTTQQLNQSLMQSLVLSIRILLTKECRFRFLLKQS